MPGISSSFGGYGVYGKNGLLRSLCADYVCRCKCVVIVPVLTEYHAASAFTVEYGSAALCLCEDTDIARQKIGLFKCGFYSSAFVAD